MRDLAVRLKLSAVQEILEGKRVVLFDNSIVRGMTSKRIVQLIRQAGAKEAHVRFSSPMIRKPCFYGVDMPTKENFLPTNTNTNELWTGYWGRFISLFNNQGY